MVTFLFSVHTITEAKQYAGIGGAEPGRWIFQPGHLSFSSDGRTCVLHCLFLFTVILLSLFFFFFLFFLFLVFF